MTQVYHDEFRAPLAALDAPGAAFDGRISARENFGPEATLRGEESARRAS